MEWFSAKRAVNAVRGAYGSSEKEFQEGSITKAQESWKGGGTRLQRQPGALGPGLPLTLHPVKWVGRQTETQREKPALSHLLPAHPAILQTQLPASLARDASLGPVAIKGLSAERDIRQGKQRDPALCCRGLS